MDLINQLKRMTDLVELQTELQTRLTEFGLKLVISHTDRHQTYKIKMKKFIKLNMKRWQFNRPANMERVDEIGESLFGKRQPIFFIFQCIYNQEENLFEIMLMKLLLLVNQTENSLLQRVKLKKLLLKLLKLI